MKKKKPFRIICTGQYPYIHQLLALDLCRPEIEQALPAELAQICTHLKLQAWREQLMGHEDQTFVKYILQGIAEGFRVGFNYQQHTDAPYAVPGLHSSKIPVLD